jgi:hypothetical protein
VVVPLKAEDLEDFVLSYGEQFVRDRLAADAELAEGQTSSLGDVVAELDNRRSGGCQLMSSCRPEPGGTFAVSPAARIEARH